MASPASKLSTSRRSVLRSTGGRARTDTVLSHHRILSPARLPIPPLRREEPRHYTNVWGSFGRWRCLTSRRINTVRWTAIVIFAVLILVLVFRPTDLLGDRSAVQGGGQ